MPNQTTETPPAWERRVKRAITWVSVSILVTAALSFTDWMGYTDVGVNAAADRVTDLWHQTTGTTPSAESLAKREYRLQHLEIVRERRQSGPPPAVLVVINPTPDPWPLHDPGPQPPPHNVVRDAPPEHKIARQIWWGYQMGLRTSGDHLTACRHAAWIGETDARLEHDLYGNISESRIDRVLDEGLRQLGCPAR